MGEIKSIADLSPDPANARRHNPRNVGMIERSLNEVGAARSIVIDENGNILAGNATVEAAAAAGIERVLVVDGDGETIIAVRREGLTPEQKKKLAYYDNRTAELADWEVEQIAKDVESGLDLSGIFSEQELSELFEKAQVPEPSLQEEPQLNSDVFIEIYCSRDDLAVFRETLEQWSKRNGVTINIS